MRFAQSKAKAKHNTCELAYLLFFGDLLAATRGEVFQRTDRGASSLEAWLRGGLSGA